MSRSCVLKMLERTAILDKVETEVYFVQSNILSMQYCGTSFFAKILANPYKPVEYFTKNEQLILMSRMHKSLLMLRITQLSRSFQNG